MTRTEKARTRALFFEIEDTCRNHPGLKEQINSGLRMAQVTNSVALRYRHIHPFFLQAALSDHDLRQWQTPLPVYHDILVEVQGLMDAMLMVEKRAAEEESLDPEFIFELHRTMLKRSKYIVAGRLRNSIAGKPSGGQAVSHPMQLADLINHHAVWLNNRTDFIGKVADDSFFEVFHVAAEAHHRFIETRPFEIGNGLVARAVSDYIMLRCGLVYNVILYEDRELYKAAARRSTPSNLAPLANFLIKSFDHTLHQMEGLISLTKARDGQPRPRMNI